MITAPVTEASASRPPGEYRQALVGFDFCDGDRGPDRQLERLADRPRGLLIGPEGALVHGAIGLGERQHGEAVVIHARPDVAGVRVLGADQAPEGLADVAAVDPEVGVLARGQEGEQGQGGHARPLLARGGPGSVGLRGVLEPLRHGRPRLAAVPGPVLGLRVGEELQAPVVDLADVARDDLAGLDRRRLGDGQPERAGGEGRQGETDRRD